jgi:hypothetical protein
MSTLKGGIHMAAKKFSDRLVKREDICEELKLIPGSNTDYITPSSTVYKDVGNGNMLPKRPSVNNRNGYLYIGITMADGKNHSRRLHRIVGEAFVPNPNNYEYCCHRDDNKANARADNLYWGSASMNTKDAFDHGLAKNAKGFDDSQSMPVCQFDNDGNCIRTFGSVKEAERETNMTACGILYQCKHKVGTKPRKGLVFRFKQEYDEKGFVL